MTSDEQNPTALTTPADVTPPAAAPAKSPIEALVGQKWEAVEQAHILATLRHNSGHRRKSADMLDIGLRTLGLKINEYREAGAAIPESHSTKLTLPDSPVDALVGKTSAEVEKMLILATLNSHQGRRQQTATTLGIGVRTLGLKLKEFRKEGLTIPSPSNWTPVEIPGQAQVATGETIESKPVIGTWTAAQAARDEQTVASGRTAA
jgi:DNA-binding NtrC family response regulator